MQNHDDLKSVIEAAWADRESVNQATKGPVRDAVIETLERLDNGTLRVASRAADGAAALAGIVAAGARAGHPLEILLW